jgi:hypothetical protein
METGGKYFFCIRRKSDGQIVCRGFQTAPASTIVVPEGLEALDFMPTPNVAQLTDADLTSGTINNGKPVHRP